jgi:predicted nucleic acid-binding protein
VVKKQAKISSKRMTIIIDTNVMFSAMLNQQSAIGDVILNSQDIFTFYSCEYLKEEIETHRDKIIKIAKLDEIAFEEIKSLTYQPIQFFDEAIIPFEYWKKAAHLVRDIDMKDIAFVALSLFLEKKIWTGDKPLLSGLAKKGFKNTITTNEILEIRRASYK